MAERDWYSAEIRPRDLAPDPRCQACQTDGMKHPAHPGRKCGVRAVGGIECDCGGVTGSMEQPSEVYCLRLEWSGATIWPRNDDRCAECSARVIYDPGFQSPFPVVRLVCTVCLMTKPEDVAPRGSA